MNTNDRERVNQVSGQVIGAAYRVSNQLGCGFLEKVYENALQIAMRKQGLNG
jgi:GxxExxY protein